MKNCIFCKKVHNRESNFCSHTCYQRKYNIEQKNKLYFQVKLANNKINYKVLNHYSNGTFTCCKCGFSDYRALSIDHINGGGSKHLKEIKTSLKRWLIKNNYPEGYQVICMNCQFIKLKEKEEGKGILRK